MILRMSVYAVVALVMLGCGGGGSDSTGVSGGGGGGGGGGGSSACPANSICMTGSSFTPSSLTVARGATVAFVNSSGVDHNVFFTSNAPSEGNIPTYSTGTVSRVMGTAGTTNFYCNIHGTPTSGMTGQIIVQ
jgi:hypothetical protein